MAARQPIGAIRAAASRRQASVASNRGSRLALLPEIDGAPTERFMVAYAFTTAFVTLAHAQSAPAPVSAAHPHAVSLPAVPTDNRLLGVWGGDVSTAVVRFAVSEGRLWVDAWDSQDGEWFVLRDPKRQGEALVVSSTMESTNWTLSNSWSWEPAGLRWAFSGAASGNDVSRRVDKAPQRP